jgi:hypothetical protein
MTQDRRRPPEVMYSAATCMMPLMGPFSVAPAACLDTTVYGGEIHHPSPGRKTWWSDPARQERERRALLKSEAKAQQLLKEFVGVEQWRVYRRTNRVIAKPGKHFWIIGDVFGTYDKFHPFIGKPDVVRVDDVDKLYATDFCVMQSGGEKTPYTDKVISFVVHLVNDEPAFIKTINRMGEKKFNEMKECALWD